MKKHHYWGTSRVVKDSSQRVDIPATNPKLEELRMGPGDYIKTTAEDMRILMRIAAEVEAMETVESDKYESE